MGICLYLRSIIIVLSSQILVPAVGSSLRKLVMSVALGLKPADFIHARVVVQRELRIPNPRRITHWNTERLLACDERDLPEAIKAFVR